jgi:hypothetical protein
MHHFYDAETLVIEGGEKLRPDNSLEGIGL